MSETDLSFCEQFESRLKEFQLLDILKSALTGKGLKIFYEKKTWLEQNINKYLELTA